MILINRIKQMLSNKSVENQLDYSELKYKAPRTGDMLKDIDTDKQLYEIVKISNLTGLYQEAELTKVINNFRNKKLSEPTEEVYFYKRLAGFTYANKLVVTLISERLLEMNKEYDLYHEEMLIRSWLGDILNDLGIRKNIGEYSYQKWIDEED